MRGSAKSKKRHFREGPLAGFSLLKLTDENSQFLLLASGFAVLNPHPAIKVTAPQVNCRPTRPGENGFNQIRHPDVRRCLIELQNEMH